MRPLSLSFVVAMLLWCAAASAQQPAGGTPSAYAEQFVSLNQRYAENPRDMLTLIELSDFYIDSLNPMRNLPLAMDYISSAESIYVELLSNNKGYSEMRALLRRKINLDAIRQRRQHVVELARREMRDNGHLDDVAIARYAEAFKNDAELGRNVRKQLVDNAYAEARRQNTIDAYYAFAVAYQGTAEADSAEQAISRLAAEAIGRMESEGEVKAYVKRFEQSPSVKRLAAKHRSKLAFAAAQARHSVESYKAFLSAYPSSDEYLQALDEMQMLLSDEFERLSTPQEYIDFIEQNNDNDLAELAMDRLCSIIVAERNVGAARSYLRKFPLDQHYNEIYRLYYEWHSADGSLQTLQTFAENEPNYPFQNILQADIREAEQADAFDLMRPYKENMSSDYVSFIRHHTGKKIAFVALQRMLQPLCAKHDWKGASERMGSVMLSFEDVSANDFDSLRALFADDAVEHGSRSTYYAAVHDVENPVMHPDGEHLYFTRSEKGAAHIQCAERNGDSWGAPSDIAFINADNSGMTLFSFYDNGKKMLLGKEGDIVMAQQEGSLWRVMETLPFPVNTSAIETDAFMLPDGSGMLLASDREGGYNLQRSGSYFHGDTALATDLYFIPFTVGGWGTPINLGVNINTNYCERSPLLSRNQKTLYFVSDGHGGMGYGDVLMVTRDDASDWTHWHSPVNLGRSVNSCLRENAISFADDERTLLIVAESGAGREVFAVPTTHDATNAQRVVGVDISKMAGRLTKLCIATFGQKGLMREINVADASKPLPLQLYKGKRYVVYGSAKGYYVPTMLIDENTAGTISLEGYSVEQLGHSATLVALPTVVFDLVASQPKAAAMEELDRLAAFLEAYPSLNIDIMVYVAGGDRRATYELSIERAASLRRYLSSRGVDISRMVISGYGNSKKNKDITADVMVRFVHK
ncbi:MAG: hypothetical protein IJR13_02490 [Bacteroidales bacterium]|nr:hypothetical protein [Bacteroidales bacterium]